MYENLSLFRYHLIESHILSDYTEKLREATRFSIFLKQHGQHEGNQPQIIQNENSSQRQIILSHKNNLPEIPHRNDQRHTQPSGMESV